MAKKKQQPAVKRDRYIEARTTMGMEPVPAAKHAGYANEKIGYSQERHNPVVRKAIADMQERTRALAMHSKEDSIQKLLEAFDVAKTQDDANAMVRAVAELNKMHGYYETEKKQLDVNVQHEHSVNSRQLQQLNTDRLLELIGGQGGLSVEDAEFEDVTDGDA